MQGKPEMTVALPTAIPQKPPSPPVAKLEIFDRPTVSHRLTRHAATIDARIYRLFIATPLSPPPPEGFPVFYALDGNAVFDLLDASVLATVPGLVIAGVGHDTPLRFDPPMRSLDYTPAPDNDGPRPDPNRPDRMIGGAAAMLDRLCGPLRTQIEFGLPVDVGRRTIFGHSLAGLFVLNALLTRPDSFAQFVAASPSIWWGDEMLLDTETTTRGLRSAPHRVLVTLGDSERRSSPGGPHWDGPAPHTLEMIRRLGRRPEIDVVARVLPGLGHAATLPASLPLALRFATTGTLPEPAATNP